MLASIRTFLTQMVLRSVLEFTLNLAAKAPRRLTLAKSRNIVATLLKICLVIGHQTSCLTNSYFH